MKKIILFNVFLCMAVSVIIAQSPVKLKKAMSLKMPKTSDDDMPGTRGASIAWNPMVKKYYAAMAGNMAYPLAVFDNKGILISDEDATALADVRGLWYNPAKKTICGNGYNEAGWFSYICDSKGMVTDISNDLPGMNQPDVQSAGAYNPGQKIVYFLKGSQVYKFNEEGVEENTIDLHIGRKKTQGADEDEDLTAEPEGYNNTTVIYTGIKHQELGILNAGKQQVELYDMSNGFLTKTLSLPEETPTELSFNFAYTNGLFWLFDIERRIWNGFK